MWLGFRECLCPRLSPQNAKKPTVAPVGLTAVLYEAGGQCRQARSSRLAASGSRFARKQTFTLRPLASQLARAANCFSLFTRLLFRRFFEMTAKFHFTEDAFALHLFLERLQRLIDIVVANQNLHAFFPIFVALRPIRSQNWTWPVLDND
ncbi:hypothetical protein CLV41_105244 [Roseibium marinum]|uniref:Uncharacterized protein n=1 Tax=Roseibium marinum TaxID=281252 RepID=A0A2S3UTS8_9HYPH|nr:hypothetical protein CLV41_105244 [Roseibium marinum]